MEQHETNWKKLSQVAILVEHVKATPLGRHL